MSSLDLVKLQKDMMHSLLSGEQTGIGHIRFCAPLSNEDRLSIYQSAYKIRLKEVIDNDHQILGTYLGDDLFDQMVDGYIDAYPSKYKSLRYFCDDLPKFLKETSPFSKHPVLHSIAYFERLLLNVFDSKDEDIKSFDDLQSIDPQLWPSITLTFSNSLNIFITENNCVKIWNKLKDGENPPSVLSEIQHWLIWRNISLVTEYQSIEEAELKLLEAFKTGMNMEEAATILLPYYGEDSGVWLIRYLKTWLQNGLITKILF